MSWEAVPGSHLGWAACAGCGGRVLTTRSFAGRGKCGTCAAPQGAGDVGVIGPVPAHTAADPELVAAYRALEVPASEHPKPLVPARDAKEVEICSAARGVRKLAESHSWLVRPTYALGWVLDARGKTAALTHTLALRMQRPGRWVEVEGNCPHVVAAWKAKEPDEGLLKLADRGVCEIPIPDKWTFDLAYGWGAVQPHHKLSAAALKETIKEA